VELGKHWVFLTHCDNLSSISTDALEALLKIHACFHEHIVISDTPSLSNWKLYEIVSRDKRWLDSGLLVVALRDRFAKLVELHKYSSEVGLIGLDPDPSIAKFFDAASKVPINFSHLSTHYTNRIDKLLKDPQLMKDFGISAQLGAKLAQSAVEEYEKKGFVTRTGIFELAESLSEPEAALIRRSGTAYYWEGVPAVLGIAASIHRTEATFNTDLLDESLRDSPVSTVRLENEELEILEDCRTLEVEDILSIRKLQTFDDLNRAIRDVPANPEEWQIKEIEKKYLNHLEKVRGLLGIKSRLRFRRLPIHTWIDIYPRLRYYGGALFLLKIAAYAFPPAPIATLSGLMVGGLLTAMSFLRSPEKLLDASGREYSRQVLRSRSDQKEKQFRINSVIGNIGRDTKDPEEENLS
jgi:hypothetical protein